MKRLMIVLTVALTLAACGDANSKSKGKFLPNSSSGGGSGGDFSTNNTVEDSSGSGDFSGTIAQAIFGSATIEDSNGTPRQVTLLIMNDTVDVCPLVPRSCESGIPEIGEAQLSAILIGPETLPVGEFTIHSQVPDSLVSEGGLVAQVGLIGYDDDGSRYRDDAFSGDVLLSTLTDSHARGDLFATFAQGSVNIEFDAEQCESLTWFIDQCL